MMSRAAIRMLAAGLAAIALGAGPAFAQQPADTQPTRAGTLVEAQKAKKAELQPYEGDRAEQIFEKWEERLLGLGAWHPFFDSAYAGGGFTVGAGYRKFLGDYNSFDMRASITPSGYKRIEAEFLAPRMFRRRGIFSAIGGWRVAPQVGFYGIGTAQTSADDRANYEFSQPYLTTTLQYRPGRSWFVLGGGLEFSQWTQTAGSGSYPSVEEVYTPSTLPGLGASPTYVHVTGLAALDSRTSPGYTRRGTYLGVEVHDFADGGDGYAFRQVNYEGIQHIPLLRETWVLSLRGRVQTTYTSDTDTVPFFMLPSLGGGSSLRGFASWRFRDRNALLLSADWRLMTNQFVDVALFLDSGKVTASTGDLDFTHLKKDYGLGFRLHGPAATPLRIEIARSNEGIQLVFSAQAAF